MKLKSPLPHPHMHNDVSIKIKFLNFSLLIGTETKRKWAEVSAELFSITQETERCMFIPGVWSGLIQMKQIPGKLAVGM